MDSTLPQSAIIAVTMLCNARCIMCNIWQNKNETKMDIERYKKLPASLKMIDITGGEPFLRQDLPDIIQVLKTTCPQARLLITTNGYLSAIIKKQLPAILKADPNIAFRVSLDGWNSIHDEVRRLPNFFKRVMETLTLLKENQVKDVGIIFTLSQKNTGQTQKILAFCKRKKISFSFNIIHDSPIYYGKGHMNLRPTLQAMKPEIIKATKFFLFSFNPKNWLKAWFNYSQIDYLKTKKRPIPCNAGSNFFFLNPSGDMYTCHIKSWKLGNLKNNTFAEIWNDPKRQMLQLKTKNCHDCWMICTTKDSMFVTTSKITTTIGKYMLQKLRITLYG